MEADYENISKFIDKLESEMVSLRRDFHKYPESGWTEFRTASKIANYLENLGLEIRLGEEILDKKSMMGLPSKEELERL